MNKNIKKLIIPLFCMTLTFPTSTPISAEPLHSLKADDIKDSLSFLTYSARNKKSIIESRKAIFKNREESGQRMGEKRNASIERYAYDPVAHVGIFNRKEKDRFPFTETDENVYNYCPSVLKDGDSYYVFYTKTHTENGTWQDYIYMRRIKEVRRDGKETWAYSDEELVLTPTEGTFDSHHVCDPSVISGDYQFDGKHYKYLMAYLATTHENAPMCRNNEIGLAVSNDLVEWEKTGRIVSSKTVANPWGVGQPSLVKDSDGKTIILYTGDNIQAVKLDDDLERSEIINVSTSGTKNMHNADFATDGKYLYVLYDSNWDTSADVSSISNSAIIYRAEWNGTFEGLTGLLWEKTDEIGEGTTGYHWNHNSGFSKDVNGNLAENIAFLTKCDKAGRNHEYTYRIFINTFDK